MRMAGPTSADARRLFVPCGISCCNPAGIRPPVPICAPTYRILGSFISIASLGVNKGVLNKIKLTMLHHNGAFAAVD